MDDAFENITNMENIQSTIQRWYATAETLETQDREWCNLPRFHALTKDKSSKKYEITATGECKSTHAKKGKGQGKE